MRNIARASRGQREVYLRGRSATGAARSLRIPLGTAKARLFFAARCFRHSVRLDNSTIR